MQLSSLRLQNACMAAFERLCCMLLWKEQLQIWNQSHNNQPKEQDIWETYKCVCAGPKFSRQSSLSKGLCSMKVNKPRFQRQIVGIQERGMTAFLSRHSIGRQKLARDSLEDSSIKMRRLAWEIRRGVSVWSPCFSITCLPINSTPYICLCNMELVDTSYVDIKLISIRWDSP